MTYNEINNRTIYFNNAATSWPKPESVYQAVDEFNRCLGANPGRGSSDSSLAAGRVMLECRQSLARLFGIKQEERIAFTLNATYGINMAMKGILQPGDHVIISGMEHNAVVRPVHWLMKEQNVQYSVASCTSEGVVDIDSIRGLIRANTRLLVICHASNVCGTIQDLDALGCLCREHGVLFMVDSAQSAGILPIDTTASGIDILAFTGHKALLGPQGTGGIYVRPGLRIKTIIEGGTGSFSEHMEQPDVMPDMLESGTPNTPGIAGLKAGLEYISETGMDNIRKHEIGLAGILLEGLAAIKGVALYGPLDPAARTAVVAFNIKEMDCGTLATILENEYGIITRSGLHCAPLAHATLGILEQGSCRLSLGWANTREEAEQAVKAIYEICHRYSPGV